MLSDPTKLARELFSRNISEGSRAGSGAEARSTAIRGVAGAAAAAAAAAGRGAGAAAAPILERVAPPGAAGDLAGLLPLGLRALQSRGPVGLASDSVKVWGVTPRRRLFRCN